MRIPGFIIFCSCLLLSSCATSEQSSPGTILIEGSLKSQKPISLDFSCGADCILLHVPFVFEIEVTRVLAGSVENSTVKGVKTVHAGYNLNLDMPWLFVLRPVSDADRPAGTDAKYWIEDVVIPHKISCFQDSIDHLTFNGDIDAEEVDGLEHSIYGRYCFFTDTLEHLEHGT